MSGVAVVLGAALGGILVGLAAAPGILAVVRHWAPVGGGGLGGSPPASAGAGDRVRAIAVWLLAPVAFGWLAAVVGPAALAASTLPVAVARWLVLVALVGLAAASIALALIDLAVHRLPNPVVVASLVAVVPTLAAAALLGGGPGTASAPLAVIGGAPIVRGVIGAVVIGALFLAPALLVPGGMGLGDVKLAVVLGWVLAWFGWGSLAVGVAAMFLLGGGASVVLVLMRRRLRGLRLAFGPWMIAGAWVGIAAAPAAVASVGVA